VIRVTPRRVGTPSTLNFQPSTLNPQPSTLNPEPLTLNPEPSTLKTSHRRQRRGPTQPPGHLRAPPVAILCLAYVPPVSLLCPIYVIGEETHRKDIGGTYLAP